MELSFNGLLGNQSTPSRKQKNVAPRGRAKLQVPALEPSRSFYKLPVPSFFVVFMFFPPSLWNVGQTGHEISNQSLAEQVKQVAENAQQQTGFVYEETSGMYYDYNTGYYYNAELGLYYDGNSGSYYYYDDKSKTFQFHSQAKVAVQPSWRQPAETPKSQHVDETSNLQRLSQSTTPQPLEGNPNSQDLDPNLVSISPQKVIKRKGKIQKTEERKRVKKKEEGGEDEKLSGAESMEEGECSDSSGDESEASSSQELSENVEMVITEQEVAEAWPPCMRIIVEETGLDNLKVGSLSIVTCTGGTLGREKEHAVHIPDINISKHHAKFTFDEAQGKYFIVDFGSRNGTYLNGERLSVALRESDPHEVSHGNILQLGSTKLLCHIHMGRETCKQCEPGLVQGTKEVTADKFSESRGKQFKKELKRLRRKFGLESSEPDMTAINKPGYEDRAQIRRNTVGSTDHNEKTQVASLEESIQPQNKGFKMLAKMGWTEGQALGKEGDGLREPVNERSCSFLSLVHGSNTRCNRSGVNLFLVSLSLVALEQVQSNLAPSLCHRQRCNRFGATLFFYAPEIF
uniref:Angiogenic factor with G patch and FHA domains 1 n=1 Tax=Timema monikensis TaxID=170555 RepID=A0A7R9E689_9NEOP|nr:unnamed protein product [Timema monikensis]